MIRLPSWSRPLIDGGPADAELPVVAVNLAAAPLRRSPSGKVWLPDHTETLWITGNAELSRDVDLFTAALTLRWRPDNNGCHCLFRGTDPTDGP